MIITYSIGLFVFKLLARWPVYCSCRRKFVGQFSSRPVNSLVPRRVRGVDRSGRYDPVNQVLGTVFYSRQRLPNGWSWSSFLFYFHSRRHAKSTQTRWTSQSICVACDRMVAICRKCPVFVGGRRNGKR